MGRRGTYISYWLEIQTERDCQEVEDVKVNIIEIDLEEIGWDSVN
jgi:hypothetical protein